MAEEDAELKELVIQSLESNGVLAKIRAQLRASVFLALDEVNTLQKKKPLENKELQKYLATENGQLVVSLVREFLNYFHLESTLSVYESETSINRLYSPKDRELLREILGISSEETTQVPLIETLAAKYIRQLNVTDQETSLSEASSAVKEIQSEQLNKPQNLFPLNDESNDGDCYRDPFFDDPFPNNVESFPLGSSKSEIDDNSNLPSKKSENESTALPNLNSTYEAKNAVAEKTESDVVAVPEKKLDGIFIGSSGLGSLKDAPPLFDPKASSGKLPPLWNDSRTGSIHLETKPRTLPDDDYEEDFHSSASIRSDQKTGTEYSIEEEIDENFSGIAEDLLSNEGISEADDTTTDHTISNIAGAGADYLESVG